MYGSLLVLHSLLRWLVVIALLYAVYRAVRGYRSSAPFTTVDNAARHWTATLLHVQLVIGVLLYVKSPLVQYFWSDVRQALTQQPAWFFSLVHTGLMGTAIVCVTVGSAKAKRATTDGAKFRLLSIYYTIAFLLILVAIPWPFSPLAQRPYLNTF